MREGVRDTVGRLLRTLRERRGLSLVRVEQLAESCGNRISRSRLSEIERGDVPVTLDDVQVLCRVYGTGIVDLFLETLAAAPPGRFPPDRDSDHLAAEGRRLYDRGQILEAGWTFDAAAERTEDPERKAFFLLSAGHCYDRCGSLALAIRRVEQALDLADGETDAAHRAVAKLAVLLASSGARLRARIHLDRVLEHLRRHRRPDSLRAYLLGAAATCEGLLGETSRAVARARSSARLYRKLGKADMALLKLAGTLRLVVAGRNTGAASRLLQEVEELLEQATEAYARSMAFLAVGHFHWNDGRPREAREMLRRAWETASRHEIPEISRQAADLLAGIEQETGRTANAGRWRKRARDFMAAPALAETGHLPVPLAGRNGVTPGRTMS